MARTVNLEGLSDEQLAWVAEFVSFLREGGDWPTLEILSNPDLAAGARAAIRDIRSGRRVKFIPHERVKRDLLKRRRSSATPHIDEDA